MTGKIEYRDLGSGLVKHLTKKAALVLFADDVLGECWVPFSVMSTSTASQCEDGETIERFRVESWFADRLGD